MGAQPNVHIGLHKGHLVIAVGSSIGGYHEGCSLGRLHPAAVCDADASKWPVSLDTRGRFDELATICYDIRKAQATSSAWSWTAFDAFFSALPTPDATPFATSGADFLTNVVAFDDNFTPVVDHRELILIAVLVAKVDGVA